MNKIQDRNSRKTQQNQIQVYIRVRPLNEQEKCQSNNKLLESEGKSIYLKKSSKEIKGFTYDSVYDETVSQEQIFKMIGKNLIESFMNGYNCSMFAYGQTGAGKTYTMMGKLKIEEFIGLQPRCIEYLFYLLNERNNPQTLIKVTYVEIYNEKIIDLLSDDGKILNIREDLKKGVFLENVTEEIVTNFSDVLKVIERGLKLRHVSETTMNEESSRSHSIFTVHFQTCNRTQECSSYKNSMFNFIDLAGSERQTLSKTTGERFKEGCNINQSLTVLGSVINSLAENSKGRKQTHVRYRDSKLTFLLKNSLGGNSKTAFIANVSPASAYFVETLSTLMFAQRAKMIKNEAKINLNVKSKSLKALRKELLRTKEELNSLKEKYILMEKNQMISKTGISEQCLQCNSTKMKSEAKILEMDNILKESLIILRKSLLRWENQIESNFNEGNPEVVSLLQTNIIKIKQLVLMLGVDIARKEMSFAENDNDKENSVVNLCRAEVKYYQEQNIKLENEFTNLLNDFKKVQAILQNNFKDYKTQCNKISSKGVKNNQILSGLETINKEQKFKIDKLGFDLDKANTELRIYKEDEKKFKNEISVLVERNRMLKSWNEQTLKDKKILNGTIEEIRYEKFNLMKKFDEDFEATKNKNERLMENFEHLEREKNIIQEGWQHLKLNHQQLSEAYLKLQKEFESMKNQNKTLTDINKKYEIDIHEITQHNQQLTAENSSTKILNEQLSSSLSILKDNFNVLKEKDEIIIEEQIINNQSLLKRINELTSTIDQRKNVENNHSSKNVDEILEVKKSLRHTLRKYEKSEITKNRMFSRLEGLKIQSKQFFNALLKIKENLKDENTSVFDDLIVYNQVVEERDFMKDKISKLTKENKNMRKHLVCLISETRQKNMKLKINFEKIQKQQESSYYGLEEKNREIAFYKDRYLKINNQNIFLINSYIKENKIDLQNLDPNLLANKSDTIEFRPEFKSLKKRELKGNSLEKVLFRELSLNSLKKMKLN